MLSVYWVSMVNKETSSSRELCSGEELKSQWSGNNTTLMTISNSKSSTTTAKKIENSSNNIGSMSTRELLKENQSMKPNGSNDVLV